MTTVDMSVCLMVNHLGRKQGIVRFFAIISRLGDGVFWYSLMTLIPFVYGWEGLGVSVRMAVASFAGLLVYKFIKSATERLRPFMVDKRICVGVAPLDKYSFPSGHTLHATSFSLIVIYYLPELFWLVTPFAFLIAVSRVVLGLHYPTDVFAGASIGAGIALLVLSA